MSPKKIIKTIILLPMWPLIWLKLGFSLHDDEYQCGCGDDYGCKRRAKAMVRWWRK